MRLCHSDQLTVGTVDGFVDGLQELFQNMAESLADKPLEVPSPSKLAAISTGPRRYHRSRLRQLVSWHSCPCLQVACTQPRLLDSLSCKVSHVRATRRTDDPLCQFCTVFAQFTQPINLSPKLAGSPVVSDTLRLTIRRDSRLSVVGLFILFLQHMFVSSTVAFLYSVRCPDQV